MSKLEAECANNILNVGWQYGAPVIDYFKNIYNKGTIVKIDGTVESFLEETQLYRDAAVQGKETFTTLIFTKDDYKNLMKDEHKETTTVRNVLRNAIDPVSQYDLIEKGVIGQLIGLWILVARPQDTFVTETRMFKNLSHYSAEFLNVDH